MLYLPEPYDFPQKYSIYMHLDAILSLIKFCDLLWKYCVHFLIKGKVHKIKYSKVLTDSPLLKNNRKDGMPKKHDPKKERKKR